MKTTHEEVLVQNRDLKLQYDQASKDLSKSQTELKKVRGRGNDLEQRNEELSKMNQVLASKNLRFSESTLEQQGELLRLKEEKAKAEGQIAFFQSTYDDLVESLKQEIDEGQVRVSRLGDKLSVDVSDKILFPSGSDKIQPKGKEVLQKVVDALRKVENQRIEVEGHTDNVPISSSLKSKFPTNWELSTARSTKVVRYLEEKGIPAKHLAAVGYGENRPVADNSTPEGRRRNRRIEIVLSRIRKGK